MEENKILLSVCVYFTLVIDYCINGCFQMIVAGNRYRFSVFILTCTNISFLDQDWVNFLIYINLRIDVGKLRAIMIGLSFIVLRREQFTYMHRCNYRPFV